MILVDRPADRAATPVALIHAGWNGLTLADLVFPFFLFAAGVSMALSVARHHEERPGSSVWLRLLQRTILLLLLGLVLNALRGGLPLRIPGVLQRIALALALAAPFVRWRPAPVLGMAALLAAAHTAVLLFIGAPGIPAGSLLPEQNIAGWIDAAVFGGSHLSEPHFDPEGLLGTLTSAATVLCGVAFGSLLLACRDDARSLARVGALSAAAALAGLVVSPWLPVNKHLWTASFVLVTAGIAGALLVAMYSMTDRRGREALARPLVPLGRNPLVVYVGSALMASALAMARMGRTGGHDTLYFAIGDGFQSVLGATFGSLAFSAAYLGLWYAVAVTLDRRGVYVKA